MAKNTMCFKLKCHRCQKRLRCPRPRCKSIWFVRKFFRTQSSFYAKDVSPLDDNCLMSEWTCHREKCRLRIGKLTCQHCQTENEACYRFTPVKGSRIGCLGGDCLRLCRCDFCSPEPQPPQQDDDLPSYVEAITAN